MISFNLTPDLSRIKAPFFPPLADIEGGTLGPLELNVRQVATCDFRWRFKKISVELRLANQASS